MQAIIEVKGNTNGGTTPQITIEDITFNWVNSSTLVAESANKVEASILSIFPLLQPRLLYQLLAPIQLYVSIPGRVDIILTDPRVFHGPAPFPPISSDIPNIRDVILEHELAAGNLDRTRILRANAPLLYALEYLVRAVLTPQSLLPELYKAIEAIQDALGKRPSFSSIDIAKGYVDYIMARANHQTADERHAPSDPTIVSTVPPDELRECLVRAREIIAKYAKSL